MANEEVQSPNDVSPTQQTQTARNETNVESQEPEAVREPSVSPNKRGLKSIYWRDYKRQKINGVFKAICKFCDKKLGGETSNGTSHLRDHLSICPIRNKRSPMQALLKVSEVPGKDKESFVAGTYTFNQDISRTELAKMIILHEYPIMMVNHAGFRSFIHSLQPLFKIPSRNTMKNDIMKLYESERAKQMNSLGKNKSRIAITTDMWTSSNQNKGYMAVTAHYIDDNWNLQNRIISDSSKELEKVKKMCEDLIFEYQASDNMVSSECNASTLDCPSVEKQAWEQGYMKYVMENASTNGKSEFVSYLEDGILVNKENNELLKDFDILGWWKQNGVKYPTLQKIARDFLAIPISTVASESAFSTSGRVVTPQRSRLKEDTLEALMCSQNWFRTEMQGCSKILASFECVDEDMDDDDDEEMSQT